MDLYKGSELQAALLSSPLLIIPSMEIAFFKSVVHGAHICT